MGLGLLLRPLFGDIEVFSLMPGSEAMVPGSLDLGFRSRKCACYL